MKINYNMLLAIVLVIGMQSNSEGKNKSRKQPYPVSGFWITEYVPNEKGTIIRYYDDNINLIFEKTEVCHLDISKRSVRKYLNKNLLVQISRDSGRKSEANN